MSIDDLNENEITVLYWKSKGLNYEQIANKLDYSVDWVQLQMSTVYAKLGFKKDMHWTKRRDILANEVYPLLPKDLKDWKKEIREEIPETKEETIPEMMALVLYDEARIAETKEDTKPRKIIREEPRLIFPQRKQPKYGRLVILAIFICLIVSAVGYGAYLFGRNSFVPPTPLPAVVQIITATFPATSLSSPIEPTETVTPLSIYTATISATSTPRIYYSEGDAVQLKQGVTMSINEKFNRYGSCPVAGVDWVVALDVTNNSGEQFILRFNTSAFSATDDIGTQYKLLASGINSGKLLGVDDSLPMNGGLDYICLNFKGQIPLKATYLLITADWISGVEHIVFRKDI
jgi:DNA-binding CsgD family transcriptional regulator